MSAPYKIEKGSRVVLRYEIFDREGELLETSEEGEPMEYQLGDVGPFRQCRRKEITLDDHAAGRICPLDVLTASNARS